MVIEPKSNDPDFLLLGSWGLRSQYLVAHEGREQRGEVYNACVASVNLRVMNDYGSPDEISSVDPPLLTTLLSWNLTRIVPPRAGLIRPYSFESLFWVLGEPFQGGNLCEEILTGAIPGTDKGRQLPENSWA
jgi:hypothetical protein